VDSEIKILRIFTNYFSNGAVELMRIMKMIFSSNFMTLCELLNLFNVDGFNSNKKKCNSIGSISISSSSNSSSSI
jgi:hypothetical protein